MAFCDFALPPAVWAHLAHSLVGYSFGRIEWWGRRWLFPFVLASMMLPFQVKMVPTFLIFTWLHWVGTFLPLIVPSFINVPLFIFLMRQFYLTHPEDFTLSVGLQAFQGVHATEWALLMAAATVFTLPVIILFFSLQRFFVQGIAVTGLKG